MYGASAYIRDTLRGKTKPNKIAWFLWALAPIAGVFAGIDAGADPWALARVFIAGMVPLVILIVSFLNPQSYWKLCVLDYVCLIVSLIAFYFWLGEDSPRTAIILLATVDLFACLPVIAKAWKHPETETGITFVIACAMSIIALPAIPVWNIENAAFPMYLLIINTVIATTIYAGQYRKRSTH